MLSMYMGYFIIRSLDIKKMLKITALVYQVQNLFVFADSLAEVVTRDEEVASNPQLDTLLRSVCY